MITVMIKQSNIWGHSGKGDILVQWQSSPSSLSTMTCHYSVPSSAFSPYLTTSSVWQKESFSSANPSLPHEEHTLLADLLPWCLFLLSHSAPFSCFLDLWILQQPKFCPWNPLILAPLESSVSLLDLNTVAPQEQILRRRLAGSTWRSKQTGLGLETHWAEAEMRCHCNCQI